MSNRMFSPAGGSLEINAVQLYAACTIGSSGATSALKGNGITSVTRVAAGIYRIKLQDAYARFLTGHVMFESPNTGSAVTAGSFSVGTAYTITTLGTTNWTTAGVDTGAPVAIGVPFVAAAVGSGTGTATAIGKSGATAVEWLPGTSSVATSGAPTGTLNGTNSANGGYLYFQCLAATNSSTTTLIPADPVSGSLMKIMLDVRNSSVKATGE